jgi:hypothetical protein
MSLNFINNVLLEEDISYILTLPEVLEAKKNIDTKINGSVYFSVNITSSIKQKISDNFGLSIDTVPMRWIKGDILPHIDTGSKKFEKTHLVYLTDSQGKFLLENNSYPITKGSAFIFDEGLRHETINTGLEPRLLLGPMSEEGLAVGVTGIYGPGGTTIYIRDIGSGIEYRRSVDNDPNTWYPIPITPCPIGNATANISSDILIVEFTTNITINDVNTYFICLSEYIQFGLNSLNNDGTRPQIIISGVTDYHGLILNNDINISTGYNSIYIFNLEVVSDSSTLGSGAGWLCQSNFGKTATDNYIVNCYSDGEIGGLYSGGLVGSNAGSNGGNLTIIGCSSSGVISADGAGGIVGYNSGINGGIVYIQSCWSTGLISGGCGGIVGSNSQFTTVTNCYSTGAIAGNNAGGIVGANPGNTSVSLLPIVIENCYSFGNITGGNSGGICGSLNSNNTIQITNCYSIGNVVSNGGSGIYAGAICGNNFGSVIITNCYAVGSVTETIGYIIAGNSNITINTPSVIVSDCYSEAGSPGGTPGIWQDIHSITVLIGAPSTVLSVGSIWVSGIDAPYLLSNMGYTPYSTTNISTNNLIRTSGSTLSAGGSSNSGIKTSNYLIIQKSGGDSGSYSSITINQTNGIISTTSETVPGVYTLYIVNIDDILSFPYINYNITTFTLTVTQGPTPMPPVNPSSFPVQRISLNQKSSFCGTRSVSTTAVSIGAMRGKGSATRIFNNCKGNNTVNFQLCQFRVLGYK